MLHSCFHTKCVSKMGRARSPKRRVRDDDFIFGLSADHARIVFILADAIQGFSADILNSEFRGRRSICWCWTVTSVALFCALERHFSWEAQYLVKLDRVSFFVASAAFLEILGDSRSAKCCIFPCKMRLQDGTSKVSEAAGARWRFYLRIILGSCSNRLYIGGCNSRIFRWHLELEFRGRRSIFADVGR